MFEIIKTCTIYFYISIENPKLVIINYVPFIDGFLLLSVVSSPFSNKSLRTQIFLKGQYML